MKNIFESLEQRIRADFEHHRAKYSNSGVKGQHTEELLRTFLAEYLPRRFGVGHGEVIDSKENRSLQTDVVIVTEEHPYTFANGRPSLFFVEGIFAVGEIKSILTSSQLDLAIENARRFRKLIPNRNGMKFHLNSMNVSDQNRYEDSAPYFLFAFETQLTRKTVLSTLAETKERTIDGVFFLDDGIVLDVGDGNGALSFQRPDNEKEKVTGWYESGDLMGLPLLLLWLSEMPVAEHSESVISPYLKLLLRK